MEETTAQLLKKIKNKNLVFCITPGRSGTKLLAELCKVFPSVSSHHEPDPNFNIALRMAQTNPEMASGFWINGKFPLIAEDTRESYIETSHLVGKGFLSPLLKLGIVPQLLLLRRHPSEVAKSMFGYAAIPARTLDGLAHFLKPDDPGVLPLPHWTSMGDYQLCFWYCLEMERRQRLYSGWVKQLGKPAITTHMNDLLDVDKFIALSQKLDFIGNMDVSPITEHHREICSKNRNPRERTRSIDFDTTSLEEQVLERISDFEPLLWQEIRSFYSE